jgi:acetyl esterase/lipase
VAALECRSGIVWQMRRAAPEAAEKPAPLARGRSALKWGVPTNRISPYFLPPFAFLFFLLAGCADPLTTSRRLVPVRDGRSVTRDLIYTPPGWPEAIPADLYRPRAPGLHPAILLVHGGGWTGGDGRWQMEPIARQLAKHGYVVLSVTYRMAPKYIYPAPVEDMEEAVKWLRANAGRERIDPSRIGAYGYSAGGYLAAMAAYKKKPADLEIRALVAGGMPSNLAFYPGGDLVPQFLGGTRQEIPQVFHDASPVNHIDSHSPPTFVYNAVNDRLVPPEHAWATVGALEENGVPHEMYWIRNRGHIAAFLFPADAVNRAIAFLDRYLK